METRSCQGIMKSIATTVIWPWLQLAAVVIGGNNGAEALHARIRPFSVSQSRGMFRSRMRGYNVSTPGGRGRGSSETGQNWQLEGGPSRQAAP